jgi:hypothetical protein
MREKSGQLGIPVFDVGGRIIIGFEQRKIEDAIKDLKYNNCKEKFFRLIREITSYEKT